MTTIRAAAVQLSPVLYSREGTVERVVAKIDELATQGVQFATFPETIVPYYPYFSFVQAPYQVLGEQVRLLGQAVSAPSSATQSIGDAASRAGMVVSIGVGAHLDNAIRHARRAGLNNKRRRHDDFLGANQQWDSRIR